MKTLPTDRTQHNPMDTMACAASFSSTGTGDLAVMSIESYEEVPDTLAVDNAIAGAEAEYVADGQLHDAREALSTLRRKHFGG